MRRVVFAGLVRGNIVPGQRIALANTPLDVKIAVLNDYMLRHVKRRIMSIKRIVRLLGFALVAGALGLAVIYAARESTALANSESAPPITVPLQVTFTPRLEVVATGFNQPLFLTHAGDDSGRMFVVEKGGRIYILRGGQRVGRPFLDISDLVRSNGYEQGLLGLAFHPEYRNNGYFFVNYTDRSGHTVVARYQVSASDPNIADPSSATVIMRIEQPFANHNGGMIAFGPDKYLYIGTGDGGSANDPLRAGQDTRTRLGKILRIDVDHGTPYGIPLDNPFADGRDGLPEIWTYGWRNPWRFSFDLLTGDMYVGDVGQNAWEEISFERAGSPGGLNYGWNIMEASHCFQPPANCNREGLVMPIAEYGRSQGISVTGGYVYRGTAFPRMQGTYFFADFGSTRLWALQEVAPDQWGMAELLSTGFAVSSFGEDEAGELYLTDFGQGRILRLVDAGS
jgi:glucose/arabinose dehydrogenase